MDSRSSRIRKLKEDRSDAYQKADAIMKANKDDASLTKKQSDEVNRYFDECERIDRELDVLEGEERAAGRSIDRMRAGGNYTPANRETGDGRSSNPFVLADIARAMKFGHAALGVPDSIKAITSSSGSAVIQDPSISDDLLFSLQAGNELAMAGVSFVRIENYKQVPKVTTYPAVIWQSAEGAEIALDASLAIGSVKWQLRDAVIRVRVSSKFLMDSSDRGRRIVQESMQRAIQDGLGKAVFTGSGLSGQPGGIETFSGLQTVDAGSASLGNWSGWSLIIDACKKLSTANVPISAISAFGSPEVWRQIASFAATDGQPLAMPELLKPVRFWNPTNQVPETYAGNTLTKMFLGDFSKIVVGLQGSFEFTLDQTRAHHLEVEFLIHLRVAIESTYEDNFCAIENILIG